jgi:hypothetical protein
MRRNLAWLFIFVVSSIAMTWPLARSPGRAPSLHADYFSNIWNLWWVRKALFEEGISPFFCDWLQYPSGVSLARHTLSLLNSIPGALLVGRLELADIYKLELLIHFTLSGWTMALLAFELTGSRWAATLAGLVYSFCPYHFYYLSQINLATMELLPLALWFTIRTYREPGFAAPICLAASAALLAASAFYYLVYAAVSCGLLLAAGRISVPNSSVRPGLARFVVAGSLATLCVGLVAAPLIWETVQASSVAGLADPEHATRRSNDLMGFAWVGPPEHILLSWPSTFGYAAIGIAALGFRAERTRIFWVALLLLAWMLSLGPTLHIAGRDTALPLPHAWLSQLPFLSMLRKPDRFVVISQLALAVLCAQACASILQWRRPRLRLITAALAPLLVLLEFGGSPIETFELRPPVYAGTAAQLKAGALIELPVSAAGMLDAKSARSMYAQTTHGKKIAQGYATDHALGEKHLAQARRWKSVQQDLFSDIGTGFREALAQDRVDLVVLHKTRLVGRTPSALDRHIFWRPFSTLRRELLLTRQLGATVPKQWNWERAAEALSAQLGAPIYDDADAQIYALRAVSPVQTEGRAGSVISDTPATVR